MCLCVGRREREGEWGTKKLESMRGRLHCRWKLVSSVLRECVCVCVCTLARAGRNTHAHVNNAGRQKEGKETH